MKWKQRLCAGLCAIGLCAAMAEDRLADRPPAVQRLGGDLFIA